MIIQRLFTLVAMIACLGLAGCGTSEPTAGPGRSKLSLEDAIATTAAKLKGEAKTLYEAARTAEPFPKQDELILGKFHGEFKEEGFESYYEYERQPGGVVKHNAVDMYSEEKEYLQTEEAYHWKSEGRVIYEQDKENPELIYFLLLEEVTDEKLKYQMLDSEFGLEEAMESEDLRGPATFPEVPNDWTLVEE
ncbi:hypothetical protein [Bremerella sp. P1]|uniref:hypothetical protein n=1 Tax=Bremerella sp. P1 TaxID=3026424 RepID=UPI002367E7CD|nr:hypothetical protein [Bremerella sp. P1]WDI42130.1 hypothetical protein PSR63_27125 [Bremerella sp. P1]